MNVRDVDTEHTRSEGSHAENSIDIKVDLTPKC